MTPPRVALIVPPAWLYPTPPVEVALAAGYLTTHGVANQVFDLNLESFDALWEREALAPLADRIVSEWQRLDVQETLSSDEQRRYAELTPLAVSAEAVVSSIAWAKGLLRDPAQFFDHAGYSRALHVIRGANSLISATHKPTALGVFSLIAYIDERSLGQVLPLARDEARNPFLRLFRDRFVPRLLADDFDLLAINVAHPEQIVPVFTLVRALRDAGCRCHVTLFGYLEDYFSFTRVRDSIEAGDHASLFDLVNSIVLYECESPLLAIAQALASGQDLNQVPSLLFSRNGQLQSSLVCDPVPIDELPTPDYRGFPLDRYFLPEPVVDYSASRGCYWGRCAFCEIGRPRRQYRCRSVDRVVDDLVRIREQTGARFVRFADQLVSPAFAGRFSREVLERGIDVRWTCRARFEPAFTEDLLRLMRRAGCEGIGFGLESATARLLDLVQKGTRLEVVERVIEACTRAEIGVRLLTIGGLPTETVEEARETRDFLLNHRQQIDGANHSAFELYREAAMAKSPSTYGIQIDDSPGERTLAYRLDFATTIGMARREGGRTALAVGRELEALIQPSFLWPVHRTLYRAHHGSDLATRLGPRKPREWGREELLLAHPKISPGVSWQRLRFDCEAITQAVAATPPSADAGAAPLPPVESKEQLAVCDLNRGSAWQAEPEVEALFDAADGLLAIGEIAAAVALACDCAAETAEATCCDFYRQLTHLGIATLETGTSITNATT